MREKTDIKEEIELMIGEFATSISKLRQERDAARAEVKAALLLVKQWKNRVIELESECDAARAENERLRALLQKFIGQAEVAAVMPDAIGKHLVMNWDDPLLMEARAALAKEQTFVCEDCQREYKQDYRYCPKCGCGLDGKEQT